MSKQPAADEGFPVTVRLEYPDGELVVTYPGVSTSTYQVKQGCTQVHTRARLAELVALGGTLEPQPEPKPGAGTTTEE